MAYTEQDFQNYVNSALYQIRNAQSLDAAKLYVSNAKSGTDTLLQYGSIGPDQQMAAWLEFDNALADYHAPASAAPSYTQTAAQPNVSSQQSYSQQAGMISSGAGTTVAMLQQLGILKQEEDPWYKKPQYVIPLGIGGLILGVVLARVL
jgi:hypothetical protein